MKIPVTNFHMYSIFHKYSKSYDFKNKFYFNKQTKSNHSNRMILLHIVLLIKQCHGILCCDCPSGCASCLNQQIQNCPLKEGLIKPRFIRNTNGSPVYNQVGGSCYAYAACSAYVNTILRIYGSKQPPSFDKCVQIADYNHGNGGAPDKSIKLLEDAFQYGINVKTTTAIPTIKEIMTQSIIISFATSKEGWYLVANGSLLVKPPGEIDDWHASLLEGYDFQNNLYIVKNSWGGKSAKPRFDVDLKATHSYYFHKVYFTLDSIANKTTKNYEQKIEKCNQTLYNQSINAAWMDKTTAIYNSNYVCECHPERKNNLN